MSRRSYDSSRRQQAAASEPHRHAGRRRALFVERGYAGTTVADIANAAGVAPATVAAAFGGKAGLLKRLVDVGDRRRRCTGRRERSGIGRQTSRRAPIHAASSTCSPGSSRRCTDVSPTCSDVLAQASGVDEQVRNDLARVSRHGADRHGRVRGAGRPRGAPDGSTARRAADVVWALTEPRLYLGLVRERGWTPEQYRTGWSSSSPQPCSADQRRLVVSPRAPLRP